MRIRLVKIALALAAVVSIAALFTLYVPLSGQSQPNRPGRLADGKPNLNGVWQVMNTANWDVQTHEAKAGPVVSLGASFAVPPGVGVVDGEEIPYKPEALATKKENGENWMTRDPEVKC